MFVCDAGQKMEMSAEIVILVQDADKSGITHDMSPLCYCVSPGEIFFFSVKHDLGPLLRTTGF